MISFLMSRRTTFLRLAISLLLLTATGAAPPKQTATGPRVVERGKFRFFDTKQLQSEETYEVGEDDNKLIVKALELDLESKTTLTAVLTLQRNLIPEKFEIKGKKPSGIEIDSAVEIHGRAAILRDSTQTNQVPLPNQFFTISSYVPLAVEMMLVRYLTRHRLTGPLRILPSGEVTLEYRGRDAVLLEGKQTQLDRYRLDGLTWGSQTLWMDADGRLVAVVGIGGDVESTLPVVREGFESTLPFFLTRAAQDAIDHFTKIANRLSPPRTGPLAIVGATLIDGTGAAPVADSVVLVEGDRIKDAGPRSRVTIPKGSTVIDARGEYVLPGLWDMHAHFFKAEFGPAYLAAGVTTVRDVGNEFEFITTLRDAFRKGLGLGPWMLLAGYIEGKNDQRSFDIQVDTPEDARAAVQRYKNAGFEQIKIRDYIKPDILKVIADEAHRLGMTLTGHVPRVINAIQAVEAGQDQISHINFVAPVFDFKRNPSGAGFVVDLEGARTKRVLELFKHHGTVIDPTLAYMEMYSRAKGTPISAFEPGFSKVSPLYAEHLTDSGVGGGGMPNALVGFLSVVGTLHRAGIRIVPGTDVVVPGHSLHRELELFVKAGLTPMEAIQAATIVPARVMNLDKEVGTIQKGKRADLFLIDADPLESISNIRKVKTVIARGRTFACAELWRLAGFRP
jgi:Amidohydrolase family